MIIRKKKTSNGDSLVTPRYLFLQAQKIWNVKCNIDVSASKENKKCRRYIDKKKNFLNQFKFKSSDILWCNFPHSKQKIFVKHVSIICRKNFCRAVILMPINTLTSSYAKKYLLPYIRFEKKMIIEGRHKFLCPRSLKVSKEISLNGYVSVYFPRQ